MKKLDSGCCADTHQGGCVCSSLMGEHNDVRRSHLQMLQEQLLTAVEYVRAVSSVCLLPLLELSL